MQVEDGMRAHADQAKAGHRPRLGSHRESDREGDLSPPPGAGIDDPARVDKAAEEGLFALKYAA